MSRCHIAALSLLALAACAGKSLKPLDDPSGRVPDQAMLLERASFELSCPAEQLTARDLGNETTAGITGCGKKAVYKYLGVNGWVADTVSAGPASP